MVFTLGTLLGTIGGALVVPTSAASLDMAIEFVIEAFAVVVIGGLGSMTGALIGALLVGLIRAVSLVIYPEFEILAIYLIVIAVLLLSGHPGCSESRPHDARNDAHSWLPRRSWRSALVPALAPPFYANLLIPFFAYAIALLGFNLLFGYTGLLSFGHAMFLGLGAYGAAVLAGVLGIRHFEIVLVGVGLGAVVVAVPVGLLCVRYTGIFFGMLTLAFGMLTHSFLFKFYHLTGGDSGMRVPRMTNHGAGIRGRTTRSSCWRAPSTTIAWRCWCWPAFVMWRIVHSPFGLHLRSLRDNAQKAEYLGVRVRQFRLAAFVISAVYGAIGGAILGFRIGVADPELVHWTHSGHLVFMTVLGGFSSFLRPDHWRPGADAAARPAAVDHAVLAFCAGRNSGRDGDLLPARPGRHCQ